MAETKVLSLSGYKGRRNTVILFHMVGAKKNVVYFPGDTQVSPARCPVYASNSYPALNGEYIVWYSAIDGYAVHVE